ncbi:MAG: hypothetical protein JNJ57_01005 [Saprospiraceae bacterium]|nr:hypothetical protein [Saprospiraceae bacterium]
MWTILLLSLMTPDSTKPEFIVKSVEKQTVVLSCNATLAPGMVCLFEEVTCAASVKILRRRPDADYEGLVVGDCLPSVGNRSSSYSSVKSPSDSKTAEKFWTKLTNYSSKVSEIPALLLSGERSPGRIKQNDYVQLSLSNYASQPWISLLEITPEKQVIVWYPSTPIEAQQKLSAGKIPLSFNLIFEEAGTDEPTSKFPALMSCGIIASQTGETRFIALLSDTPRPLSDWLPAALERTSLRNGPKQLNVNAWQVGPGYFNPAAKLAKTDTHSDHLDCRTWMISTLAFTID